MRKFIYRENHRFPFALKDMENNSKKLHTRILFINGAKYDVIYETRHKVIVIPHVKLFEANPVKFSKKDVEKADRLSMNPFNIRYIASHTSCTENVARIYYAKCDLNIQKAIKEIIKDGVGHEKDERN